MSEQDLNAINRKYRIRLRRIIMIEVAFILAIVVLISSF